MLGPSKGYIDLLDEHLVDKKTQEQNEPMKWNPLRPSSAGYCERALGYAYDEYINKTEYPKDRIDTDSMRLLELGKSVEYSFIKMMQYSKLFQVKYQQQALTFVQLDEKTVIEGSIDFCLYIEQHRCVADVKSKGTRFSSWRSDSWGEIDADLMELSSVERVNDRVYWIEDLDLFFKQCNDDFMKDNFYQLNLYANTEFMRERGVDHAVLFYYEKNKSRLREIRFKPSAAAATATKNKFILINSLVKSPTADRELLKRESTLGSIRCSYCRFAPVCRPGIDATKEYFATWPERKLPVDICDLEGWADSGLIEDYNIIKSFPSSEEAKEIAETRLCYYMNQRQIKKMKFPDGEVYELKLLKSPRLHFELRRSK